MPKYGTLDLGLQKSPWEFPGNATNVGKNPLVWWTAFAAVVETNSNFIKTQYMAVHLAQRTLDAINSSLEKDQGAAYRVFLEQVIPHMGDAYRGEEKNPYRSHMGASGIGKDCARAIWYSFRWFTKPQFGGRILRLFNRGHLEEARFIALLLSIGVKVYQQDENGKQFRISDAGGHFGGSGDGVGLGIPDLPANMPCLLEFKTHSDKSFAKVAAEGVKSAKFEHFVQMNMYMRKMNLNVALYGAVNKNNDELYLELVPLDTITADQFLDRGRQLVFMATPPKKLSESPGWFECKFCDHRSVCHLKKDPEVNCRTCFFSRPDENGTWSCSNPVGLAGKLSTEQQLAGCASYLKI